MRSAEDRRQLVSQSSRRWRDADIAAGAPGPDATAAAERVLAACTGG